MIATHKCGCPPKPPCSPCCTSGRRFEIKSTIHGDRPASCCCKRQRLPFLPPPPKIEKPPPCCPTAPTDSLSEFEDSRKIRSDIAERGLPYTELEAVINNNRLVIRTQKEPVREEYDPVCECIEDAQPIAEETTQDQVQAPGNRTVTVYPRPKSPISEQKEDEDETYEVAKPIQPKENPNIFLLRVRKKVNSNDKGYNIDVEFKTPRPWSLEKRLEYQERAKVAKPVVHQPLVHQSMTLSCNDDTGVRGRKQETSRNKKKKKM